jgi:hypothetical protein
MAEWERIVVALEKRSMTLAGVYMHARLLSWDDRGIELGFPGESLQATLASSTDTVASLKKHLAELCGAPLEVKVKTIPGIAASPSGAAPAPGGPPPAASASVAEREDERRRTTRATREEEARAHPITEAVVEAFGAAIKEIKVDG